jgi:SNF2 family DNA or RNA helicase
LLDGLYRELIGACVIILQKIALSWMQKRESGRQDPCGGILADDQGLGKTISTIALILKNRAPIDKQDLRDQKVSKVEHSTVDLVDDEDDQSVVKKQGTQEKPGVRNGAVQMSSANGSGGQEYDSQLFSKGRPAAGTLVVCPTSVLRQWAQEIHDKVTAAADLTVLIYHGGNRTKDPRELAKYDLVLSTYSIVSMEVPKQPVPDGKEKDEDKRDAFDYGFVPFAKPKKEKAEKAKKGKSKSQERLTEGRNDSSVPSDAGPLARVAWFRVVLDEAQSIKNCRTQVARATWGLRAKRRWCLSGTPIQNSVDDLFSYFRFLRYFPWDAYKKFCFDIKDPISRTPAEGYRRLQAILKPVVLRRTKTSLIDGQPIVKLPPRIVKLKQAEFSLEERSFYTKLEAESRAQFQVYAAAGTVQSNYVNILWMLLRLRQACDHPMLVKKCNKTQTAQTTAVDSVQKLSVAQRLDLIKYLDGDMAICVICQVLFFIVQVLCTELHWVLFVFVLAFNLMQITTAH